MYAVVIETINKYLLLLAEVLPLDYQSAYKCIKPRLPAGRTAIFVQDTEGNIVYKESRKDIRPFNMESGYMASGAGDSGAPYWKKEVNTLNSKNNDFRSTLVAIHTSGAGCPIFIKDYFLQCRTMATKITDEILRWIKIKGSF